MVTDQLLQATGLTPKEARKLQRREWVLRGVLDYNLNLSILYKIIGKYEHIDAVPLGYHQAEFYIQDQEEVKRHNPGRPDRR